MVKAKKGDFLSCKVCGLVLVVDEACGNGVLKKVLCCAKPMVPGKTAATRVKKIAAAKKAPAKPAKAAAKVLAKAPAKSKTVSKAKSAVKKPAKAKK